MMQPAPGRRVTGGPLVTFFGAYDPQYPRNLILRKGWRKLGLEYAECRTGTRRKVHTRYPLLIARYVAGQGRRAGTLFVPDFRHKDVPLAWLLARVSGKKLIFDPLVSRYETRVLDRGDAREGSAQAWHNRNLDRISLGFPDIVISDTGEHAAFYSRYFGVSESKIRVIPVGFDEDTFDLIPPRPKGDVLRILFYGSYLPLHGVETIIGAASRLAGEKVHFRLVGEGQTYRHARSLSTSCGPGSIDFLPSVPPRELPDVIASCDVALGIFGTTPKASMVVPNKVYQALAAGRAVVTADTPAIREFFRAGEHLLTVPPGDPCALAEAIALLGKDEALRMRLAESGARHVREHFNSVSIARKLARVVEELSH